MKPISLFLSFCHNLIVRPPRLIFILTALFFFELIVQNAPRFYPRESYQKYLIEEQHGKITKKHNGIGSMGNVYKGQPFKIAFLGMSELAAVGLPYFQGISKQLKQLLCPDKVHIDNFSISFLDGKSAIWQLESMAWRGRTYDIIIFSTNGDDDPFAYANHFAFRWTISVPFPYAFLSALNNFFYRRRELEPLFRLFPHPSLYTRILKFLRIIPQKEERNELLHRLLDRGDDGGYDFPQNAQAFLDQVFRGEELTEYTFQIRQYPQVTDRLIYRPLAQLKIKVNQSFTNTLAKIKEMAEKMSSRLYWVPKTFAYHPEMILSYNKIYRITRPSDNFDPANPTFYDPKTMASIISYKNQFYNALAHKQGFEILDYNPAIINRMPYEEGLFLDDGHVSAKGAIVVAQFFAKKFAPLVEAKIKSKSE